MTIQPFGNLKTSDQAIEDLVAAGLVEVGIESGNLAVRLKTKGKDARAHGRSRERRTV
jgi:hypothetical protein